MFRLLGLGLQNWTGAVTVGGTIQEQVLCQTCPFFRNFLMWA
ncbi:MAG: hypothetical protein SCI25_09450 [Desulfuromonadales bacterium]|nr:hypothetical protein [Desulfuromonadales bacterium]